MVHATEPSAIQPVPTAEQNGNIETNGHGVKTNGHQYSVSTEQNGVAQMNGDQAASPFKSIANVSATNGQATAPGRQNGGKESDMLHITDKRTGLEYDVLIKNNSIQATDFLRIKLSDKELENSPYDNGGNGLRLVDPGFQNTAVKESTITFMYV